MSVIKTKNVGDPNDSYQSLIDNWRVTRAFCQGTSAVKAYDSHISHGNNILIPFSTSMDAEQYNFFKQEAELPGIVSEFQKMLVGGLLRKPPVMEFKKSIPEEAVEWIKNHFSKDDLSIMSFLADALDEEITTSRCWIRLDFPKVSDPESKTNKDFKELKPYPIIYKAESVINWRTGVDSRGRQVLDRIIIKGYIEDYSKNEFHPDLVGLVEVHELVEGKYKIRIFKESSSPPQRPVVSGSVVQINGNATYEEQDPVEFKINNEEIDFIPFWPLNGSIEACEPFLMNLVDKERALYNKISRRNHLLYGACTYTPYVAGDLDEEKFDTIVKSGLGSWLNIPDNCKLDVLKTPTDALSDMDRAIVSSIEEMAKLGVRMLSPESAQSGVALQLRNASQNARLGSLSSKVSAVMADIITTMLSWQYDKEIGVSDIEFKLSEDFDNTPLGADWLRLATEWYEKSLIPRTAWLSLLKRNDMISADYDDNVGRSEINSGDNLIEREVGYSEKLRKEGLKLVGNER
jgi:hypothetical protein